jgi:protein SCO1/2
MSHRTWLIVVVGLVVVGAAAGALLARWSDRPPAALASGTWLPEPREVVDFTLTDTQGRAFGRAQLGSGAPTAIFFGFASCPHVCPTTLAKLAQAKRAAPQLRVILVTVDPQQDTPERLGKYVRAFHPEFEALTGEMESIAALERNLAVVSKRVPLPGGGYTIDHSAAVYLLDGEGRWVAVFTPPLETEKLVADLRAASERLS